MSDALTPAEQARAARWAADWMEDRGWYNEARRDLRDHADMLDPPATAPCARCQRED